MHAPHDLGPGAGFLVLSIGKDRKPLLWECLASIRRHYPQAPVHVISDSPVDGPFTWVSQAHDFLSRHFKTRLASLSPFEITVAIDDDAIIHRPFGDAAQWLETADLAIAPDFTFQTLAAFKRFAKFGAHTSKAKSVINDENSSHPYLNTGVMIFRRSQSVLALFDEWHRQWLACQHTDQQPLICALEELKARVAPLPRSMNYSPSHYGKGIAEALDQGHILHFVREKISGVDEYCQIAGIAPAPPDRRHELYRRMSTSKGAFSGGQIELIGRAIHSLSPCRLLVYGTNDDWRLWAGLNSGGRTCVVLDDLPEGGTPGGEDCELIVHHFHTRRGVWNESQASSPPPIAGPWDVVLIDGPKGNSYRDPGRQLPIQWCAALRDNALILVHDWNRPWDQWLCQHHLGTPSLVLPGLQHTGDLALWLNARISLPQLFGHV